MVSYTAAIGLLLAAQPSVTVQGRLENAGGGVSGSYDLTVRLYWGELGPAPLHTSVLLAVPVENGVFSAVLTDIDVAQVATLPGLWVGVRVESEPELPRQPLGAAVQSLTSWLSLDVDCSACIQSPDIADDAVTTFAIAPYAVTESRLGEAAVTAGKIADNAVIGSKIADTAITAPKLEAGSVTAAKLDLDAVTTPAVADGAITQKKLAAFAVGPGQLAPLAVTTDKIALGAITTERIASSAITADKIALGAVTVGKIGDAAITNPKIMPGAISSEHMSTGSVLSLAIADKAVKANHLSLSVLSGSFCSVTTAAAVPGSDGALICALSYVDDDSAAGWCSVRFDAATSKWLMQTGSDCGANACSYVCLK